MAHHPPTHTRTHTFHNNQNYQVYLLWLYSVASLFSIFLSVSRSFRPLPLSWRGQISHMTLYTSLSDLLLHPPPPHLLSPPVIVSCSAVVTKKLTGHCFPLYQEPLCPALSLHFMWQSINRPQAYCHQAPCVCSVMPINPPPVCWPVRNQINQGLVKKVTSQ